MNEVFVLTIKVKRLCMLFGNNPDLLIQKLQTLEAQCQKQNESDYVQKLIKNIRGLI